MSINEFDTLMSYIIGYRKLMTQAQFILLHLKEHYVSKIDKFKRIHLTRRPPIEYTNDSQIDFEFLGYVNNKLQYEIFVPQKNPLYLKLEDVFKETIEKHPEFFKDHSRYYCKYGELLFSKLSNESQTLFSNRWYQTKNMSLIQISSLFEAYIKSFVETVFRLKPDLLSSTSDNDLNIKIKEIVGDLSHGTISETKKVLKEKINLTEPVIDKYQYWDELIKWKRIRNLFVHTGGKIDEKFVRQYPSYAPKLGQAIQLTSDDLCDLKEKMVEFFMYFGNQICVKFNWKGSKGEKGDINRLPISVKDFDWNS